MVDYRVLGPLEVHDASGPLPLPQGHPRRVLAVLLVDAGRPVSAEVLIDRLWGADAPATARAALQVHVSKLRRHLGGGSAIRTTSAGYVLDVGTDELDACCYERAVHEARQCVANDPTRALELLDVADRHWRGVPYAEVADEPWVEPEVARLTQLHLAAEEVRAEAELRLGRHATVVDRLRAAAEEQPLRERRWEQLMLALYRSGRQAEALRAFRRASQVLAEELGVEPGPALRDLDHRILLQDPSLGTPLDRPVQRGSLPVAATPLVGRAAEVHDAGQLLTGNRLVTIVGPGGCGKTRIAIEVAREAMVENPDGAWLIELSPASGPSLVAPLLASGLGLTYPSEHGPTDTLDLVRSYLSDRTALLVLDACEQVAAEVAACVQVILTGAPGVRVLVSSRQSLGLTGEAVLRLDPLQVPSVDADDDELARSPSVRLFLERSRGSGTPDVAELRLIGELCRFLEGLPLAIELVAATSRGLAMSDVLARLPSRLVLDRGPEGDIAVRPAIAWSHDMLPPGDRAVFRRLSVFAAGFSYRGAVAVAAPVDGPEAVGGSLARLVQASLISVDPRATPARYRMLDTVREYATEQLTVSGEVDDARDLLAAHLGAVAAEVRTNWVGVPDYQALARLDGEHDNCRSTLDAMLTRGEAEAALVLAVAWNEYWCERGFWAEGAAWLRRAIDACDPGAALLRARGLIALVRAGAAFTSIAAHRDELLAAGAVLEADDHATLADRLAARLMLAIAALMHGDVDEGLAYLASAREGVAAITDDADRAWAETALLTYETLSTVMSGDVVAARAGQYEAAERFLALGDPGFAGRTLMYAGTLSRMLGDDLAAREDFTRSVELCGRSGSLATQTHSSMSLAVVAGELDDPDAPTLLHRARAALETTGDLRCCAVVDRTLGEIELDAGRLDAALTLLRRSLAPLAATDLRSLSVALADIAAAYLATGRVDAATALLVAARHCAESTGLPLTAAERRRLTAAYEALPEGLPPEQVPGDEPAPATLDEVLCLAGATPIGARA